MLSGTGPPIHHPVVRDGQVGGRRAVPTPAGPPSKIGHIRGASLVLQPLESSSELGPDWTPESPTPKSLERIQCTGFLLPPALG